MNDDDFKNGGPSFFADLVRQGGTPVASGYTNDDLAAIGPDHWGDMAREDAAPISETT